jgi:dTDP-4-dehydrorhamnose reductase
VRHLRQTPETFRVVAYDRKAMDLMRPAQVEDHLAAVQFEALINCAALTNLEHCEERPEEAHRVNSEAPRQMAEACLRRGARMIQISTDYVYDGVATGQRREDAQTNPTSVYAASKLAGDLAVLGVSPQFLVARTSWVFGPDRPSFIDQILEQARTHAEVSGIGDKFSTPSYSVDLARWLGEILLRPEICGVLNLCNAGEASWASFAQTALDLANQLGWPTRAKVVQSTNLSDLKSFRAQRPRYTSMNSNLLASQIDQPIRPWADALQEYLATYYVSPVGH